MNGRNSIRVIALGVTLLCSAQTVLAGELEALVQEALGNNPQLQSHQAQVTAAEARIPQASALEDPRIGFRASNLPIHDFGLNNTPMTGLDFSIAQKIPFPGTLGVRKAAERSAATATLAVFEETRNRIRFEIAQTYYQLYQTDQSLRVTRDNLALLSQLAQVAEARYSTGESSGPDVFRVQSFRSWLANDVLQLEQERESLAVRLNTLLNRPETSAVKLKYRFKQSPLPAQDDWQNAVKSRPLLQAVDSKVTESEERLRLARRDYLPNFDFMVGYRLRGAAPTDPVSGSDFISGGVTLNIPLWAHWRQSKKVQEHAALKLATERHYESVHNESTFQAAQSYQQLRRQHRQIKLYLTRLLPEVRATYDSSLTAYQVDEADFFSTIEALKDRHTMQRNYYVLRADYETSLERLKWLTGRSNQKSMEAR